MDDIAGGGVTLRRGSLALLGSVIAAISGFALSVLVGRSLGTVGAGVFFSITGLFVIASAVLKLGADTAELWRLPRLVATRRFGDLRRTIAVALVPPTVASVVVSIVMVIAAEPIARTLTGSDDPDVVHQVVWSAVALAVMAPAYVMIAATRGLGSIGPFVGLQNVGLPVGRLVAVGTAVALGAGGVGVMAAWSLPAVVVAACATVWLASIVRRHRAAPHGPAPRAAPDIALELWGFAAPRGVTASIEATLVTVNTLVVGVLIGPAAAGVFGALSRFVTAGTLAEQAIRVVVGPRFSALLGLDDRAGASRLYATTTPWVVVASWPIFVVIAVGAPALLGVFGPGFAEGADALAILGVAMCVSQLAGNVQTVLLMSGRSAAQLRNKIVALVVLLALDAVLIPLFGIVGAALAWAVSLLVDTALAFAVVRRTVGIDLSTRLLTRMAIAAVLTFGVPTAALVRVAGFGMLGLVGGVSIGALVYAPLLWRWRHDLALTAVSDVLARGTPR